MALRIGVSGTSVKPVALDSAATRRGAHRLRRGGGFGDRQPVQITPHDAPAGAGARHALELDSPLARELSHQRGGEQSPPVGRGGGFGDANGGEFGLRCGRHGDTVVHGSIDVGVGLARRQHHRDRLAHRDRRARFGDQPAHDPVHFGDVFDDGLLGFDLGEWVTNGDLLALRDEPRLDDGLAGVGQHLGHPHDCGHQRCPIPARTFSRPATTSSVLAMAARSSTLEMLGDASVPDTRSTGWSSQSKSLR